jgi:hypothetical protein
MAYSEDLAEMSRRILAELTDFDEPRTVDVLPQHVGDLPCSTRLVAVNNVAWPMATRQRSRVVALR